MKLRNLIYFLISIMFGFGIFSQANAANFEYPVLYRDLRVVAMGGAAVAIGGSSVAVFHNPAGLSLIDPRYGFEVNFPEISFGFSKNAIDFFNDIKDAADTGDLDGDGDDADDKLTAINNVVSDYMGENFYGKLDALFSIAKRHKKLAWTVGIFGGINSSAIVHQGFGAEGVIEVKGLGASGAFVGLSSSFYRDIISLGMDVKFLYLGYINHNFYPSEIVEHSDDMDDYLKDEVLQDGTSVTFDIGLICRPFPKSFLDPAVGFSIMNISEVTVNNDIEETTVLPRTYNIGFSIRPKLFKKGHFLQDLVLGVDLIDITKQYEEDNDWGKRLRMGAEIKLWNYRLSTLTLRGGFYQGYPSYGAELKLFTFYFQFVSYAEEIGGYAGQCENRRYLFSLAIKW